MGGVLIITVTQQAFTKLMANQLPSNLYSGYAQVVNTQPSIQFAARLLAQREAKRDAMERYLQDAITKVTSTGMRDQEIPLLMQAKSDLQKYSIENKNALRNNETNAMLGFKNKLNTLQEIAQTSIAASKPSQDLLKAKLYKPDIAKRWDERTVTPMIEANENPTHIVGEDGNIVRNPNYHPMDVNKIVTNPKEYEAADWQKEEKDLRSIIPPDVLPLKTIPHPSDPLRQIDITSTGYSTDKQRKAGEFLLRRYNENPRLRYSFEKSHGLLNTPIEDWQLEHTDEYDKLNSVYKPLMGKDIETPDEVYAAATLQDLAIPKLTSKIVDNATAKNALQFSQAKQKMYLNDALIRGRMKKAQDYKEAFYDFKQAKTTEEENGVLNKFIDNSYNSGTDKFNGKNIDHIVVDGKQYKGKFVSVPNSIAYSDFKEVDTKTGDLKGVPKAFFLSDDKKSIIPIYRSSPTGGGAGNEFIDTHPIDIQTYKAYLSKLLLTKKAAGAEVTDDDAVGEFDGQEPDTKPKTTITKEVHKVKKSAKDYGL